MKRTILLTIMLLCVGINAHAQKTSEISMSYGRFSIPAVAFTIGGVLGTAFTLGSVVPDGSTGAANVEYDYNFNEDISIGAIASYEMFTMKYKSGEKTKNNFISIMPAFSYHWFVRDNFRMYSKVGIGAMVNISQSSKPTYSYAFQASPIGADFGSQSFRGFLEAGIGFQGLLHGGIRFRF